MRQQQLLSLSDVIALLAKRCEEAGSQRAFAMANDISPQYVNDVLRQKREPSEAILKALGLQQVKSYTMMAVVRAPRRGGKVEIKLADRPWGTIGAHGWTFDPEAKEFTFRSGRKKLRCRASKMQNDLDYLYGDVPISPNGEIVILENEEKERL